jgi:2-methylaconitate cis-trans-isomerase PrpF
MRIPAVFMRGGTSRGLFFHAHDLPADPAERERVILASYGSPDPNRRQVDGMGGATANTSKVAIIGRSDDPDIDVTYTFGQVAIDRPLIDWAGNCGNISSAVGPFAIDEGLVPATGERTTVRFLNTNTNKVIVAHVPTRDGKFDPHGDLVIPGIANAGSAIQLDYINPGGAVTGKVLPTGSPRDHIEVDGQPIAVSIVDAANPLAFIRLADVGLTGRETADDIDGKPALLGRLEAIRAAAGKLAGIADSAERISSDFPSVPKLTLVGPPVDYGLSDGRRAAASDMTLRLTMMSMGRMHPSIALTGSICAAVAVKIPGTLAHEAAAGQAGDAITRIGHPAGIVAVTASPVAEGGDWRVDSVGVLRTARRLFEGAVHIL